MCVGGSEDVGAGLCWGKLNAICAGDGGDVGGWSWWNPSGLDYDARVGCFGYLVM